LLILRLLMERNGLAALAESFALDRAELHRLTLLNRQLFEHLCKEIAVLSGNSIRITDLSLRVEDYSDFAASLWPSGFGTVIDLDHRPVGLFGMQEEIAEGLLWGDGPLPEKPETDEARPKGLTRIEARILAETVGGAVLTAFDQVFRPLFGTSASIGRGDADGKLAATASVLGSRGQLATAAVECSMGELHGSLFFTLLISTLHPVRAKLTREATERGAVETATKTAPPSSLLGANLELQAILGSLAMPLTDIRALKPGAVISLGQTRETAPRLELRYAGQPLFYGTVVEDQGWRRFLIEEKGF